MRITVLAFAILAATAAPALAADARHITVRLRDLDLGSPAGARSAMARLSQAAAAVCSDGESPAVLRMSDAYQRCRWQAFEAAVARIRTPAADAARARLHPAVVELARR